MLQLHRYIFAAMFLQCHRNLVLISNHRLLFLEVLRIAGFLTFAILD